MEKGFEEVTKLKTILISLIDRFKYPVPPYFMKQVLG